MGKPKNFKDVIAFLHNIEDRVDYSKLAYPKNSSAMSVYNSVYIPKGMTKEDYTDEFQSNRGQLTFFNSKDYISGRINPNADTAFYSRISRGEDGGIALFQKKNGRKVLSHEVIHTGTFYHWWIGEFTIDVETLVNIKENFDRRVLGIDIALNPAHMPWLGAYAWTENLDIRKENKEVVLPKKGSFKEEVMSLWADEEMTKFGERELIAEEKFGYTSAELSFKFEDVQKFKKSVVKKDDEEEDDEEYEEEEDHDKEHDDEEEEDPMCSLSHKNLLLGSAATNNPFIPRLNKFSALDRLYHQLKIQYRDPAKLQSEIVGELRRRGAI